MKSLATLIFSAALIVPAIAGDTIAPADAKELKALQQLIEAQAIPTSPAPAKTVVVSGYVETSYTKVSGGSNACANSTNVATSTKNSGSVTTEKINISLAPPNNVQWFGGFEIEASHSSSR